MLPKERKRAFWSIAVGAIAALGVFAWPRVIVFNETRALRAIVAVCRSSHPLVPPLKKRSDPSDSDELVPRGYVTEADDGMLDKGQYFASNNLHTRIGAIIKDPEFAKFDSGEKREVVESVLHADKEFTGLSPANQAAVRQQVFDSLHLAALACEPHELAVSEHLGAIQQEIVHESNQLQTELLKQGDATEYAALVFALFCLPLVWYFLLDRLREIGAALSGRDQSR